MAHVRNAPRTGRSTPGNNQVPASEPTAADAAATQPLAGLTSQEARELLRKEGPNALPASARRSLLSAALSVLREPMFVLLVVAAGIYLVLGDLREALVLAISILVVLAITLV